MSVHSLQLSESCIFPCRTIGIPKECCRNIVARSPFHRHPAFSAFDRRSQYTNPKHITASMNMNIDDTFPRGSLAFGLRALPAHYTSSSWKPMSSAASSTSMRLLKTHPTVLVGTVEIPTATLAVCLWLCARLPALCR